MGLDSALTAALPLPAHPPPDQARLFAAIARVQDRWPDTVANPPPRAHEMILAQMLGVLDSDRWAHVKVSHLLRAFRVAFSPDYVARADVAPIIDFAYAEMDVTTHRAFLNAMVAIYLVSYVPNGDHSLILGGKIAAKWDILNAHWRAVEQIYPSLFDASRAHLDIAVALAGSDDISRALKGSGFANPDGAGLMQHVRAALADLRRAAAQTSGAAG
jgi:hypothetical protein